jgi:hypothetical protein
MDEAELIEFKHERGFDSGTRRGEVTLTLNFDITADEGLGAWLSLCKAVKDFSWPDGTTVTVKPPVKPQPNRGKKQTS